MSQRSIDRFRCPTSGLNLSRILKRELRPLWLFLSLATAIHLSLSQINLAEDAGSAVKPLTTKFIKREPRLIKPLELRKRPRPKQRPMRRKVVSVVAKANRPVAPVSSHPLKILDRLAKPSRELSRYASFGVPELESRMSSGEVIGSKEPEDRIDMSLEMVDVKALDMGRYHAMVIQDAGDRKKIKGFFHLGQAYVKSVADANKTRQWGIYYDSPLVFPTVLQRLTEQMNRYTSIRTDVTSIYTVDSSELLKTPWVLIANQANFVLNDQENKILGRYLTGGGFVFASDVLHNIRSWSAAALRKMFVDALASAGYKEGRDWLFEKIPGSHPIFHCFFDFDRAPPGFDNWAVVKGWQPTYGVNYAVDYIEGITIEGRLVGILDCKGYVGCWGWWNGIEGPSRFPGGFPNGTRQYQFAVNLIVYALIQEGSITQQVMEYVE